MDLGAPERSLGSVPEVTCAAPGMRSVKLRLTIAVPPSRVPTAFVVRGDGGVRLPSRRESCSTLPPQPSAAALGAASTAACGSAAPVVAAEA